MKLEDVLDAILHGPPPMPVLKPSPTRPKRTPWFDSAGDRILLALALGCLLGALVLEVW